MVSFGVAGPGGATVGVDLGTTSARATVVGPDGMVLARAEATYPLLTPRPGWVEQRPEDWWAAVHDVLKRSVAESPIPIDAIGLTGQMHGSVFLDAHGDSIRPALTWNDQRTERQARDIATCVGPARLQHLTGNPSLTGFQAPKVLWLRDNEPDAYRRVAHVLLPKDYIRYRLTGEFATDVSDAAGTLFLDLRRRAWSDEVLDALDIPREWLPDVFESPERTADLTASAAAALGLPAGIPVAAGAGDNAAAAVGTGIVEPGLISSSIGTSGVLFAHVDDAATDPSGRVHAFCHAVPYRYALLAVTLAAGGSLQWWRNVTGLSYEELVGETIGTPAGAGGLLFLPYLTGERTPHMDPSARGAFVGLTIRHTRAHMTRAVMEGVAFSLRSGLEAMRSLGVEPTALRATGGGARIPFWRRLQADVLGLPIERVEIEDGASYGAALLGHVAAGTAHDVAAAAGLVRVVADVEEPDRATSAIYDELFWIHGTLYAATRESMHALAASSPN
jgi:xylulokinase